ncbi:MAG: Sir2 family NAD-dependent protein deacetylase [Dehalococcoidia bacterium]|nr:Sir2 family NAD-dependent protein deacetylase [Dehalococcoidia bacterium]
MTDSILLAADALVEHDYVICLTGAGMSVESGIRPFRGPGGIWTERGEPPLDDYQKFVLNPAAYWRQLLAPDGLRHELESAIESAVPHPGYYALAELESLGVVKYIITQNIDGLHRAAGSMNVAELHGNHAMCRCVSCGTRVSRQHVDRALLPPRCEVCGGIMKDDVVVFGEPIPGDVAQICLEQTRRADCMLLVGTSAYVYPAAGFPRSVANRGGTLIEIGPCPTEISDLCDIVVRGTAATALSELARAVAVRITSKQALHDDGKAK